MLTTCPVSNNCSHICAIVDGFPTCFCNLGYELAFENNAECSGKLLLDHTKSHDFLYSYLEKLNYFSSCYIWWYTVIDKDECILYSPCDQECTNLPGSFECSCKTGYELHEDGATCSGETVAHSHCILLTLSSGSLWFTLIVIEVYYLSDVDECLKAAIYNIELCTQNTVCANTEGAYECPCISGFKLINGICQSKLWIIEIACQIQDEMHMLYSQGKLRPLLQFGKWHHPMQKQTDSK